MDLPVLSAGGRFAYAPVVSPLVEGSAGEAEAGAAGASPSEPSSPPAVLSPIQGPLMLDGRYLGDLQGAVDLKGDGVVDARRLLELLDPLISRALGETLRSRIGAQQRVRMGELADKDFSLTFDSLSLSFVAQLSADARARQDLRLAQYEDIDPSAFDPPEPFAIGANLALGQQYSHDLDEFSPLQAGIDAIANFGGFGGLTLTGGVDYDGGDDERPWRRREIRLSRDIFKSAIRLTAGEFTPPVDSFQGSRRLLGVSAARAYAVIRPFQNIRPSGRREFVLDRDSFVEVEVNGIVTERLKLQAGPYSLSDFPFGQGAATIRLLVDDERGRREIAEFDLFGGSGLLDRGVIDFGFSAGALEEGGELEYGSTLAATGFVRMGVLDRLTLGANAQVADGRSQIGLVATQGGGLGLIQVMGAASHNADTGRSGAIAAVDYLRAFTVFEPDDVRITASAQATSRYFQDAFAISADNRERWRAAAQLLFRLRGASINLGASMVKGRDGAGDQQAYNLSLSRSFGPVGANLSIGHQIGAEGREDTRVGIALSVRLGGRWNADARYDSNSDLRELAVSRTSTGRLGDLSGSLRIGEDRARQSVTADIRYINNRFDAQVISNRLAATTPGGATSQESLWRLGTFVGFTDGVLAVGRPSRDGFVIADKHPSLARAKVGLTDGGGEPVARTGLFGPALASVNRAYGVQRYMVTVDPLPPGYDLGSGVLNAFPGFGSGYHLTIGSDASRTVLGVLRGPDGPLALVSGRIEAVGGKPATEPKAFFTNRGGRFVGDGLAPGLYRLVVGDKTVGQFEIRPDQQGVIDVGQIFAPGN